MYGAAVQGVDRRRRLMIGSAVAVLHAGALVWLGLNAVPVMQTSPMPAFDVVLLPLSPHPSPVVSPDAGGGASSAPSTVHRTENPRVETAELTAPIQPAVVQPLVVGVGAIESPTPGRGQGGTGDGTGLGDGVGPGTGGGLAAVLIAGPAEAVITRDVQHASLMASDQTHVVMRCRIRLNRKLDGCRVIAEHPQPSGYRTTALMRATEFRFRPAERGGRAVDGLPIVVALAFPAPEVVEPATAPVDAN